MSWASCQLRPEYRSHAPLHREYSIGLRCEVKRKASGDDPKRAAELAAYFTHARLQPGHCVLSLRSAMTQFYKLENFATAAIFARRLLEMNAPAKARVPAWLLLRRPPLGHAACLLLLGGSKADPHLHSC